MINSISYEPYLMIYFMCQNSILYAQDSMNAERSELKGLSHRFDHGIIINYDECNTLCCIDYATYNIQQARLTYVCYLK